VTGVPKLVLVVKPLARLGLVTVPVAARLAINIEVGHGAGAQSLAFDPYSVRRPADAQWGTSGRPRRPRGRQRQRHDDDRRVGDQRGQGDLAALAWAMPQRLGQQQREQGAGGMANAVMLNPSSLLLLRPDSSSPICARVSAGAKTDATH
jgi:hypothetical protein